MLRMLYRQAKYFLYLFGLETATSFQFRQKYSNGLQLAQQEFWPRNRFGNRLVEHLKVVPDTYCILKSFQPFERRLHFFVAEIVKKLNPVPQIFGGDTKGVQVVNRAGFL